MPATRVHGSTLRSVQCRYAPHIHALKDTHGETIRWRGGPARDCGGRGALFTVSEIRWGPSLGLNLDGLIGTARRSGPASCFAGFG